ncbi:MAG: HAMP domain-containing histidine kinase [Deltaproteobacteria bacterium]|jgi:signal transduction histidine kinase|nr:HAMP domain-containing histidine kinase [Deltaproteobacteria bacterium]
MSIKKIQQAVINDFFEIVNEESMSATLAFDLNSNSCLYANRLAAEILEFPINVDPVKVTMDCLIPKSEFGKNFRAFSKELLEHEGFFSEVTVKKWNDQVFIASVMTKQINVANEKFLLIQFQDLSVQNKLQREILTKRNELKLAYEEMLLQNKQLRELDLAKDRFIALTTHELRTPVSAIVSSAEILKHRFYETQEQLDEFVSIVYDQGKQLLELINDILDLSRINAGKMDYYIEEGNLFALVEEQMNSLNNLAQERGIRMSIETPSFNSSCYFDAVRLCQVISNVLTNAIKYNNENGTINIWLEENTKFINLYIRDSGVGIASEDIEKVFNEFETIGKVSQHSKGTGLGMPISKKIIESMGGEIHLKSTFGEGSTFWIMVPKEKKLDPSWYRGRPSDGEIGS